MYIAMSIRYLPWSPPLIQLPLSLSSFLGVPNLSHSQQNLREVSFRYVQGLAVDNQIVFLRSVLDSRICAGLRCIILGLADLWLYLGWVGCSSLDVEELWTS